MPLKMFTLTYYKMLRNIAQAVVIILNVVISLHVCYGSACLKRSDIISRKSLLISPCRTHYHHSNYHQNVIKSKNASSMSTLTTNYGVPAIYVGDSVYVSAHRFEDRVRCITKSNLPKQLTSAQLTGAGFTNDFLHLIFGTQIMRVRSTHIIRWLQGDNSKRVLDVVKLAADPAPVTEISTMPCCSQTLWCKRTNRLIVAYSLSVTSVSTVVVHVSEDQGNKYRSIRVPIPADSKPVRFVKYPTATHDSLFYNHDGRGFVRRISHFYRNSKSACNFTTVKITKQPLRQVLIDNTLHMLTILLTEAGSLHISGNVDAHFDEAALMDISTNKKLSDATAGPRQPLKTFTSDRSRWVIVDAEDWVFLGSRLYVFDTQVRRFQLNRTIPAMSTSATVRKTTLARNSSDPLTTPLTSTEASSTPSARRSNTSSVTHSSQKMETFVLRGRTLEHLSVIESPNPEAVLRETRLLVPLTPYLAQLDAKCEIYQMNMLQLFSSEPVVDKNSSFEFEVSMVAESGLAVRPVMLLSSPMLVSEMLPLSRIFQPDATVNTRWRVAVRSHPENQLRPYMTRPVITQIHVTSTVAMQECPARSPPPVTVLVGCNPWMRLVILNKRVDEETCRRLKNKEIRIPSTPKHDLLLRHQQRLRGAHAVRLEHGVWRVLWKHDWHCPLLSGDKAIFKPVMAIETKHSRVWHRTPLVHSTVMHEIHGLEDFDFDLTLADMHCRHKYSYVTVSWRQANANFMKRNAANDYYNPTHVLNTSNYISCNHTAELHRQLRDSSAPLNSNDSVEVFGLPGLDNSIMWADSEEIHVFEFHVVDPLFTYCDLRLTVPVFFMHASDVSKDTKLNILLVGIGVSLLLVVVVHICRQLTMRVQSKNQIHTDQLLAAAHTFAYGNS